MLLVVFSLMDKALIFYVIYKGSIPLKRYFYTFLKIIYERIEDNKIVIFCFIKSAKKIKTKEKF